MVDNQYFEVHLTKLMFWLQGNNVKKKKEMGSASLFHLWASTWVILLFDSNEDCSLQNHIVFKKTWNKQLSQKPNKNVYWCHRLKDFRSIPQTSIHVFLQPDESPYGSWKTRYVLIHLDFLILLRTSVNKIGFHRVCGKNEVVMHFGSDIKWSLMPLSSNKVSAMSDYMHATASCLQHFLPKHYLCPWLNSLNLSDVWKQLRNLCIM